MTSTFATGFAAVLAATLLASPATAQSAPPDAMKAPTPAAAPAGPAKPVTAGDSTGRWSGQMSQVGRLKTFALNVTLTGAGGETSYPDQNCAGKLARTGSSGVYSFFTETITTGKFDAAAKTGCLSGSVTLVRSGNVLIFGWVAAHDGQPIIAYGTLSRPP